MNIEIYDENNPEHNDPLKYEVVEWDENIRSDMRRPSYVMCGDIVSDAQRR